MIKLFTGGQENNAKLSNAILSPALIVFCLITLFFPEIFYASTDQPKIQDEYPMGLVIPERVKQYWLTHTPSLKYSIKDLKSSIDWSSDDSPVKNQGYCGSCWAFAAVALIENLGDKNDLAEQVIVSCIPGNDCGGGWYGYALEYIHDDGIPPEDCYPYLATNGNCNDKCTNPSFLEKVTQYDKYGLWGDPNEYTVNNLKALLQTGPVCVAMLVPTDGSFSSYPGGIYNYDGGSIPGNRGHAILAVGYNDDGQYFKAKNSWGTNWGEDGYFRIAYDDVSDDVEFGGYPCMASGVYTEIPSCTTPTAPSNCSASDNYCNKIVVNWQDNSNDESGFKIYRNGSHVGTKGANQESYTDYPSPGTYSYYVKAYNDCGNSNQSNSDNGTRMTTPTAPSSCSASDNYCDKIVVNWQDNSNNETGFRIYRNGSLAGTKGVNQESYTDYPSTGTYTYYVKAYNGCGSSSQSNSDDGTRMTTPTAPSSCSASDNYCDKIVVNWQDNSNNETGFKIYRNGSHVGTKGANQESYTDYPSPGTYSYYVKAYNDCGSSNQSNSDNGTRMTTPTAPSSCSASDNYCDKIVVNWQDNSNNETGFKIYRNGSLAGTKGVNQESYTDHPSTGTYTYYVKAYNGCGSSSQSNSDDGTRMTTPTAPSSCSASDNYCDKIVINWQDNSNNETGFKIYRNGSLAGTKGANQESYTDHPSTGTYTYYVKAYNGCGSSSQSNSDDGTRMTTPTAPSSCSASDNYCDKIVVNWQDNSNNETGFKIYRNGSLAGTKGVNQESYTDYPSTGTYTYYVKAYNGCGSSSQSNSDDGTRMTTPMADFIGSPRSGCAPLTVDFTDQSTNTPTSWLWDFGDGGSSTQQNTSHTYDSAGTYTVVLTATNDCGSNDATKIDYITVNAAPVADFTGSPRSGCSPLTVDFTDQSTNNPTSWSWDFGDGSTSDQQNPSHTYSTSCGPKTYIVTLTVTNECGTDYVTKNNYVTVGTRPVADFVANNTSGCSPLAVQFTDLSTCNPTSWLWDFGDGSTSDQQNPSHTYSTECGPDTFTVTLTVTNECGTDSVTKSNYIIVGTSPVANFSVDDTSGCSPLIVQFTDLSTCNPTSWLWDFGDGGPSAQQNPSHTYNTSCGPMTYTVTLTVNNGCGSDSETKINYITVSTPPIAAFTTNTTSGCSPLTVQFTDQSTCNPTSWSWDFGDGEISNQQNPSHIYSTACGPTTYAVTLTVTNECGTDSVTKLDYITVSTAPVVDFAADKASGCSPLTVQFTDLSSCNPTSWLWGFGDGDSSTQQNPSHIYQNPGYYTVTLMTSNPCGSDTCMIFNYIHILAPNIEVQPLEFHVELIDTMVDTKSMNILNKGPCTLKFNITESDKEAGTSRYTKLDSGQEKTRTDYAEPSTLKLNNETSNIGWLSVNPDSGSVDPNDSLIVEIIFNAKNANAGSFTSYLLIHSNDPDEQIVTVTCSLIVSSTGVSEFSDEIPKMYYISQSYPNPFIAKATIEYALPEGNYVNIKVFDITGSIVRTLVCEDKSAGYYKVIWDGCNTIGKDLPSSVYFLKFFAGDFTSTRKLILIR